MFSYSFPKLQMIKTYWEMMIAVINAENVWPSHPNCANNATVYLVAFAEECDGSCPWMPRHRQACLMLFHQTGPCCNGQAGHYSMCVGVKSQVGIGLGKGQTQLDKNS
jgi:hypothetical protein